MKFIEIIKRVISKPEITIRTLKLDLDFFTKELTDEQIDFVVNFIEYVEDNPKSYKQISEDFDKDVEEFLFKYFEILFYKTEEPEESEEPEPEKSEELEKPEILRISMSRINPYLAGKGAVKRDDIGIDNLPTNIKTYTNTEVHNNWFYNPNLFKPLYGKVKHDFQIIALPNLK